MNAVSQIGIYSDNHRLRNVKPQGQGGGLLSSQKVASAPRGPPVPPLPSSGWGSTGLAEVSRPQALGLLFLGMKIGGQPIRKGTRLGSIQPCLGSGALHLVQEESERLWGPQDLQGVGLLGLVWGPEGNRAWLSLFPLLCAV